MLDGRSPLFSASVDNFRRLPRHPILDSEALDSVRPPTALTSSTLLDNDDCDDVESTRFRGASKQTIKYFGSRDKIFEAPYVHFYFEIKQLAQAKTATSG